MIVVENVGTETSSLAGSEEESNRQRPYAVPNVFKAKVVDNLCHMNELPYGSHFETNKPNNPQSNPQQQHVPALINPPIPQGVHRFRRGGFTRYHCREFVLEMPSRDERLLYQALEPSSNVFSQSHFIGSHMKNRMAFKSYALSAGAKKMLAEENAGGASELSEALSFEVFHRVFNADLYKTEMEIQYNFEQGKRTDYLVHMKIGEQSRCIAVSVTRAMKFGGVFTLDDADYLLRKKLYGVLISNDNVLEQDRWEKQILHILCEQKYIADRLQQVFRQFQRDDPEFVDKTLVFVTVCENASFIFTNRDEQTNNTNKMKQQWMDEKCVEELSNQSQRFCSSCKQPLAILGERGGWSSPALPSPLQPLGKSSPHSGDYYSGCSDGIRLCSECKGRRTMETLVAAMTVAAVHLNSNSPNGGEKRAILLLVSTENVHENQWPVGRGIMWELNSVHGKDEQKGWEEEKERATDLDGDEKNISALSGAAHQKASPLVSVLVDLDPSHSIPADSASSEGKKYIVRKQCDYCLHFGHDCSACFQQQYDSQRCAGLEQKEAEEMVLKQLQESLKNVKKSSQKIPKIILKFEEAYQKKFNQSHALESHQKPA